MSSEAEKCVREVAANLNKAGMEGIVLGHLQDGEITENEVNEQVGVAQQAIDAAKSCKGHDVSIDLSIEEHLLLDEKSGTGVHILQPNLGIQAVPQSPNKGGGGIKL